MTAPKFRKDQYVVCRYRGRGNGDLIVGRVESVRRGGVVVLESLLNGALRMKREDVLHKRNIVVTKTEAERVVGVFERTGSAAEARGEAVKIAQSRTNGVPITNGKKGPPPPSVATVVELWAALSDEDRRRFAKEIWGEVLDLLGVQ